MKYAVTYCTYDQEAGANPMWHSALLLSKVDESTKLLEVVDAFGFYGVPTTQRDNSMLSQLKLKIGLDVDLQGNHGMLRREEVRFLDMGCGLHGTTFELTKEQFERLQEKCFNMITDQASAVREIVGSQGIPEKPKKETRLYAHEKVSKAIYDLEKEKALAQGREPRLKPFDLQLTWGLSGPSLATSHTCKTQSIALLANVLSQEQIDRLTENGKHPSVPRYSGEMESIYLHSTGPLREHKKASGAIVHYRDSSDPEVRLFWTVLPQNLEALSDDTIQLFEIDEEYCEDVKNVVRKLQRLEWLLRNATLPEKYQQYQADLINKVIDCYKAFSTVEPKKETAKISGLYGFYLSLFSVPRSTEECSLQRKILLAKVLINSLYMAIADKWKIYDDSPAESVHRLIVDLNGEDENKKLPYENPLEAVASYLSVQDKKTLCKIIGRNYLEGEDLSDEELSDEELSNEEPSCEESEEPRAGHPSISG